MIDLNSEFGQRVERRLAEERIGWLTTVDSTGTPQPRPVWFVWDGQTFLIYSMPTAKKIVHIAQNPNVSLHFNTDAGGKDIQVFLGTAQLDASAPTVMGNAAYRAKYHAGILAIGMDDERYSAMFSAALRVTPTRLRGLEPLPEIS